jgi:hypothetical protein
MIRLLLLLCPAHKPGIFAGDVLKSTLPETMAKIKRLSAISHMLWSFLRKIPNIVFSEQTLHPEKMVVKSFSRDLLIN